jgi:hypothetical protein
MLLIEFLLLQVFFVARAARTRILRPCFRLSSPLSTSFLTVASPPLVNSPDSSSRGEHRLPDRFSLVRTQQHRRSHAGEARAAPFWCTPSWSPGPPL